MIMVSVKTFDKVKPIYTIKNTSFPDCNIPLPLFIESGDDTQEGEGPILLDWTNISDKEDISIFDSDGNQLHYWFEEFDPVNKKARIMVSKEWVRDGSLQFFIAYGRKRCTNFDGVDDYINLSSMQPFNDDVKSTCIWLETDKEGNIYHLITFKPSFWSKLLRKLFIRKSNELKFIKKGENNDKCV